MDDGFGPMKGYSVMVVALYEVVDGLAQLRE